MGGGFVNYTFLLADVKLPERVFTGEQSATTTIYQLDDFDLSRYDVTLLGFDSLYIALGWAGNSDTAIVAPNSLEDSIAGFPVSYDSSIKLESGYNLNVVYHDVDIPVADTAIATTVLHILSPCININGAYPLVTSVTESDDVVLNSALTIPALPDPPVNSFIDDVLLYRMGLFLSSALPAVLLSPLVFLLCTALALSLFRLLKHV